MHPLSDGLTLLHRALDTHLITSHHALPLMVARGTGLVVEVTDGDEATNALFPHGYRGSAFFDLAKSGVIRLARIQAAELRRHGVAAVALTPGFLRSEAASLIPLRSAGTAGRRRPRGSSGDRPWP